MRKRWQLQWRGSILSIVLRALVLAFIGLSLAVTASQQARFAVAMGYAAEVRYVVGAIFDFAKALLPITLAGHK